MKTLRKNLKRKRTIRSRIRGAGNQVDACAKYNIDGVNIATLPMPVKMDKGSTESLTAISSVMPPPDDILILKVGSNDSLGAIKEGSRGKDGVLFIESPFTPVPGATATTLIDIKQPISVRPVLNIIKLLQRYLPQSSAHVVSISPEPSYDEFSYPFEKSMIGDDAYKVLLNVFIEKIQSRKYVQSLFPIAPGSPIDPSTKLLDLIVARESPLVLFNAMGSVCFRSFKYIVDMRKLAGRATIYMGLVDNSDMASCDLLSQVYPDGDKNCASRKGKRILT